MLLYRITYLVQGVMILNVSLHWMQRVSSWIWLWFFTCYPLVPRWFFVVNRSLSFSIKSDVTFDVISVIIITNCLHIAHVRSCMCQGNSHCSSSFYHISKISLSATVLDDHKGNEMTNFWYWHICMGQLSFSPKSVLCIKAWNQKPCKLVFLQYFSLRIWNYDSRYLERKWFLMTLKF